MKINLLLQSTNVIIFFIIYKFGLIAIGLIPIQVMIIYNKDILKIRLVVNALLSFVILTGMNLILMFYMDFEQLLLFEILIQLFSLEIFLVIFKYLKKKL